MVKEVKNILLVGRTGSGKSALANVLVDGREVISKTTFKEFKERNDRCCCKCKKEIVEEKNLIETNAEENKSCFFHEDCFNPFKESSYSASETKDVRAKEFRWEGVNYCVIDTPGFDNTQFSKEEVLDKIKEKINSLESISQVFFVSCGKFTEEDVENFKLLENGIFGSNIADKCAIVRTRFTGFGDKSSCIKDSQEIFELIASYNYIVHVDNPSMVGSKESREISKESREISRNKLLNHLKEFCEVTQIDLASAFLKTQQEKIKTLEEKIKQQEQQTLYQVVFSKLRREC